MIQLNLLPDIKATYIKAERTKKTVITLSLIITSVSIGVVVLLASVAYGANNVRLNSVQSEIDKLVSDIQSEQDLDKVLTVQNQLVGLEPLHDGKPVAFRLFKYLQQTTPKDVKMDTYAVNYSENTMKISGNAPNLEIVNKYVDTLKFTEIKLDASQNEELPKAFDSVVLRSFSTAKNETTYDIDLTFNPSLFDSQSPNVQLVVPKITTTRSQIEAPGDLFKQNTPQVEDN